MVVVQSKLIVEFSVPSHSVQILGERVYSEDIGGCCYYKEIFLVNIQFVFLFHRTVASGLSHCEISQVDILK